MLGLALIMLQHRLQPTQAGVPDHMPPPCHSTAAAATLVGTVSVLACTSAGAVVDAIVSACFSGLNTSSHFKLPLTFPSEHYQRTCQLELAYTHEPVHNTHFNPLTDANTILPACDCNNFHNRALLCCCLPVPVSAVWS